MVLKYERFSFVRSRNNFQELFKLQLLYTRILPNTCCELFGIDHDELRNIFLLFFFLGKLDYRGYDVVSPTYRVKLSKTGDFVEPRLRWFIVIFFFFFVPQSPWELVLWHVKLRITVSRLHTVKAPRKFVVIIIIMLRIYYYDIITLLLLFRYVTVNKLDDGD